jgi:hypothetical protein
MTQEAVPLNDGYPAREALFSKMGEWSLCTEKSEMQRKMDQDCPLLKGSAG